MQQYPPVGGQIAYTQGAPLDPCQQQAYDGIAGQKRITDWPYYSRVKFVAATVDAAPGPFIYNLALGVEAEAFSYAVSDAKQAGGFTVADGLATIADTNLTSRFETVGGQNVIVKGIALQLMPAAMHLAEGDALPHRVRPVEQQFAAALWNCLSVELLLNGSENTYRLGNPGMIPGAGGLTGGAEDGLGLGGFAGDSSLSQPYPQNGWPVRSNFFKTPAGLVWRNQSNSDSQFAVKFRTTRAIRLFSGGSPEMAALGIDVAADNAPATASTGTRGWEYPTELAVEIGVFLVGTVIGPRSRSA